MYIFKSTYEFIMHRLSFESHITKGTNARNKSITPLDKVYDTYGMLWNIGIVEVLTFFKL